MTQTKTLWPGCDGEMAARVGAYDWTATSLGPVANWSERLKLMVEQVLASPLVSSLVCGPERILIYNDTAAKLYGDRHPAALGHPLPKAFPEGWAMVAPFYDRAFAGETVQVTAQPLDTRGESEATDEFDALLAPVREADGRIAFVHMTGSEIGARKRAEATLRESETRHSLLIGSWAQAEWETDANGVVTADSPSWRAYTGQTIGDLLGYGWLDAIHPDDRVYAERQWRETTAVRGLVNAEFRLRAPNGGWRWTNVCAAPVLDASGAIEKWAGMNIDIDARKRAEGALRESEERFAQFAASSSDALWIRDAGTLAMEYTSPAIQTIYGICPDAILGDMQRWVELIVPEDRDTAIAHIEQAQAGASVTHEFRIRRPLDSEVRWICNTDFPLRDQHGRVQRIGGIAQDITAAKRSGLRLEVLVNELQHRARNVLGVVSAIASRTVKQGGSVKAFEERLQALSRAQGLLSQGGSDTVDLGALVRAELAAHADAASDRVTIAGPDVYLRALQVQNFALALHELATNAVKYGALKVETGRLKVIWELVLDSRECSRLALSWNESGVTVEPAQNTRRGYGTELITEALAYALQAEIDYTLGSDGVRCRIEIPV